MNKNIALKELSTCLDSYLDPLRMEDTAINGLQVSNSGTITKIATAVTASLEAIEEAADLGAQALIVHHGIFRKGDSYKITGTQYRKIKALIDNDIALLCYHLPLDAHVELGNNWKAAQDLGLKELQPFAYYYKTPIGVYGFFDPLPFDDFKKKVETYYDHAAAFVKIKDIVSSAAIVSGAGEKSMKEAAQLGVDCFISGRFDEPVWDEAHEEHISFLGLGHYATEVVGVKALAHYLHKLYEIPCTFIKTDNPF